MNQSTENTNNAGIAQGEGAQEGASVSAAAESSVSAEIQDANKTEEGGQGAGASNGEEAKAQKEGAENKAQKQDSQKNAEFARKRREAEREAEIKAARINAIKDVLDTNPYTQKPIEDESDVEEYLLMKQIDKDGRDPIADYPEYIKKQAREKSIKGAKEKEASLKIDKDIEEFAIAHPNVNINEVLSDKNFASFAEGKLGKKSLSDIYKSYLPIKEAIEGAKREAQKDAHSQAVAKAAVGSLTNASTPPEGEFFTKEQVQKMSKKEIHDNYEKIRRSQARW